MTRYVDNNGIGALYATFDINQTDNVYELDIDNVGDSVALTDSNKIGHGTDGGKILGRLEHICGGLATVQITGVARFDINTTKTAPGVGNAVVVDGAGKVYQAPAISEAAGDPAGGNIARGAVLAVNSTAHTCDVLL